MCPVRLRCVIAGALLAACGAPVTTPVPPVAPVVTSDCDVSAAAASPKRAWIAGASRPDLRFDCGHFERVNPERYPHTIDPDSSIAINLAESIDFPRLQKIRTQTDSRVSVAAIPAVNLGLGKRLLQLRVLAPCGHHQVCHRDATVFVRCVKRCSHRDVLDARAG